MFTDPRGKLVGRRLEFPIRFGSGEVCIDQVVPVVTCGNHRQVDVGFEREPPQVGGVKQEVKMGLDGLDGGLELGSSFFVVPGEEQVFALLEEASYPGGHARVKGWGKGQLCSQIVSSEHRDVETCQYACNL